MRCHAHDAWEMEGKEKPASGLSETYNPRFKKEIRALLSMGRVTF